jgi:molybdenum cofactor synthesis domain-containing protein
VRVAILTISDRSARGERPDASGPAIEQFATGRLHAQVVRAEVVPDEREAISAALAAWCDEDAADIVFTTGGTGFAPRDVTPEATRAVIEREAPGLAEAMRQASLAVTAHAMLSRAVCGIRGRTLIVNLPGSPKAVVENLQTIAPALPHAVQLLRDAPMSEQGHHAA